LCNDDSFCFIDLKCKSFENKVFDLGHVWLRYGCIVKVFLPSKTVIDANILLFELNCHWENFSVWIRSESCMPVC